METMMKQSKPKVKTKATKIRKEAPKDANYVKQSVDQALIVDRIIISPEDSNETAVCSSNIESSIQSLLIDDIVATGIKNEIIQSVDQNCLTLSNELLDISQSQEALDATVNYEQSYVYSNTGAYSIVNQDLENCSEVTPTAPPLAQSEDFETTRPQIKHISKKAKQKVQEGPLLITLVDGFNIDKEISDYSPHLFRHENEQIAALPSLQPQWHSQHKPQQHPLFLLISEYSDARLRARKLEYKLTQHGASIKKNAKELWSYWHKACNVSERAVCSDKKSVLLSYKYSQARLNKDVLHTFQTNIADMKAIIFEQFWPTTAQIILLKASIHDFIYKIQSSLLGLSRCSEPLLKQALERLSSALDVLFYFVRITAAIEDETLAQQLQDWLKALSVPLQSTSLSWQLNLHYTWHVLRCSPSVVAWAAAGVTCCKDPDSIASMMSLILQPVPDRHEYFADRDGVPWIVIDEGGDDDDTNVAVVVESTIIKLLAQVPLHEVIKHYVCQPISDVAYIEFLSYLTSLLDILQVGLTTYGESTEHCYLIKMIGKMIHGFMELGTARLEMFHFVTRSVQSAYDTFCSRCINVLLTFPAIWQYVAGARYSYLGTSCRWRLFLAMVGGPGKDLTFPSDLCQKMSQLAVQDQSHLMAALTSLVLKGPPLLRRAVVLQLFYAGFVSPTTRDSAYKDAKELIASLVTDNTDLLSELLQVYEQFLKSKELDKFGDQEDLWNSLPTSEWLPTRSDVSLLIKWLGQSAGTAENLIARCILRHLNYNTMDWKLQKDIADAAVGSGGPHLWIIGETNTLWVLMCKLRLHLVDRNAESELLNVPDIHQNPDLELLISQGNLGAMFLALQTTTLGHSVPLMYSEGFKLVRRLFKEKCYEPAFACVDFMTSLFWNCPESLASSLEFMGLLGEIVVADESLLKSAKKLVAVDSGQPILRKFGAMINSNLERSGSQALSRSVQMWMGALTSLALWQHCAGAVYLLDIVCRRSFGYPAAWMQVLSVLEQALTSAVPSVNVSPLSLFRSAPKIPTILPGGCDGSASWFAFAAICVEFDVYEKRTSMWPELLRELWNERNKKASVDRALKKVCSSLKIPVRPSFDLSIYRWAAQALAMPDTHPLNILVWQKLLAMYLSRVPGVVDRGSPGASFFEGLTNGTLKKTLCERLKRISKNQPDVKVFRTFDLWLNEPKLLQAESCFTSLPTKFEMPLLATLFRGEEHPWVALLPLNRMFEDNTRDAIAWSALLNRVDRSRFSSSLKNVTISGSARYDKILQEFKSNDSRMKIAYLNADIPDISSRRISTSIDELKIFIQEYGKAMSEIKRLESSLFRSAGKMYVGYEKEVEMSGKCEGFKREKQYHPCSGTATAKLKFVEWFPVQEVQDLFICEVTEISENFSLRGDWLEKLCYLPYLANNVLPLRKEPALGIFNGLIQVWSAAVPTCCSPLISSMENIILELAVKTISDDQTLLYDQIEQTPEATFLHNLLQPHKIHKNEWVSNYEKILNSKACHLISKFDLSQWLQAEPHLVDKYQLVQLTINGLKDRKVEATRKSLREHLLILVLDDFPIIFDEILKKMLRLKRLAGYNNWLCIVDALYLSVPGHPAPALSERTEGATLIDHCKIFAKEQSLFTAASVLQTINLLGTQWRSDRNKGNLYELYSGCTMPVIALAGMLAFVAVTIAPDDGLHAVQHMIDPWVVIDSTSTHGLLPFQSEHAALGTLVSTIFEEVIRYSGNLPGKGRMCRALTHALTWYCEHIAADGVSEFVLSVVHQRLKLLPWEQAVFSCEEAKLMVQVFSQRPFCQSFIGNVFLAVDWDKIVIQSLTNASTKINSVLHTNLLLLIVFVSFSPSLQTNSAVLELLRKSCEWAWHLVDADGYAVAVKRITYDCNYDEIIASIQKSQKGSANRYSNVLMLLQIAAGMGNSRKLQHASSPAKRQLYVLSVIKCVATAANSRGSRSQVTIELTSSIMTQIESALQENVAMECRVMEGMVLLTELLRLLQEPSLASRVEEGIVQWITTSRGPILTTALLQAAGNAVDNPVSYSALCEAAIQTYFYLPGNLQWPGVMGVLSAYASGSVPVDQVLISNGCLLTLHAIHLQRLNLQPHDGRHILNALLQMLSTIKVSPALEPKLVLVSGMALMLASSQPDSTPLLKTLSDNAMALTIDRNSGFLSKIGLQKSTSPTISFRLCCLTLSAGIHKLLGISSSAASIAIDKAESDKQFGSIMGHVLTVQQQVNALSLHSQLCSLIYSLAAQLFGKLYFEM